MCIDVETARAHLNLDSCEDDILLWRLIEASQNHIEQLLGFKLSEEYGGDDKPPVPQALIEAILQLVTFWYEHRGSGLLDAGDGYRELPFGVHDIVREFRRYTYG